MAYLSNFYLIIEYGDENLIKSEHFQSYFESITGYAAMGSSGELYEVKWYDFNEDMLQISRKYPQVIFKLFIDGEGADDSSIMYYCNGQSQDANLRTIHDDVCIAIGGFSLNYPELLI